jgi:endonuclease YncB( thermonuclease family)
MNRHLRIRLLLVLAIFILVSASWASEPYQVKVVGITDGDTIKVLHNGTQVRIRLYGIDNPREASGIREKGQTIHQ